MARRRPTASAPAACPVILLNKPYGVLCQFTADGSGKPTLADFVRVPDVYPAGRLDADSEGLVVLTADGALQARITSPRRKLAKVYWVEVEGVPIARPDRAACRRRQARRRRDRAGDGARDSGAPGPLAENAPHPHAQGASDVVARDHADRRPEPAGAADDRRGRAADIAPHPARRRTLDDRGACPGHLARGIGGPSRAIIAAPSMILMQRGSRRSGPSRRFPFRPLASSPAPAACAAPIA